MLEGKEYGYTPVAIDFTYYGTREFTLVKDGYESLTVMQKVSPPWYQRFPIDFVSDNFVPFKVTNRQEFVYQMRPQEIVPTKALLDRAKGLRAEAQIKQ